MKNDIYPSPWDLRYFREVAQTRNLSRAAERLGVGQPGLSLSLKRLEEQLRVKLFLRRSHGLELTDAGQRLLRQCDGLLADWEAIVAETRASETELRGRFGLGCHPSVALYALDQVIRDIYAAEPAIELVLTHGLSRVIGERIISGQIDFGIVVNPVQHPDLVILKLATDEVCFWQAPDALEDVLIYNPDLAQSQSLLKKSKTRKFARTLTSDNLEVIATLARSGAGVAILPHRLVRAVAPALKKIAELPSYKDEIAFVHRADIVKTAASRFVLDHFRHLKI